MPQSAVLDTAIALAFIFLLLALASTAATEFIANLVSKRAKYLLRGLRDLLDGNAATGQASVGRTARLKRATDTRTTENRMATSALEATATQSRDDAVSYTNRVMGHPLVSSTKSTSVSGQPTRNPSYLSSASFAAALIDIIVPGADNTTTLDTITSQVKGLPDDVFFKPALLALATTAGTDIASFRTSIERWYDAHMDRVSGAYKRWAKRWILLLVAVLVIGPQVDTAAIASSVYADGPLRQAVVAAAENKTLCQSEKSPADTATCVNTEMGALHASSGLPLGWGADARPTTSAGWLLKVLGWALTILAASFGAPFWFEALTRLGSLRNTGPKPATTA